MAVEFRCDHCGKLNRRDSAAGGDAVCEHCGRTARVPEALASLPTPQIPANESEDHLPGGDPLLSGKMAVVMPLLISVLFHMGLFLVMLFVVMFAYETRIPEDVVAPYTTLSDRPSRMSESTNRPVQRSDSRAPDDTRSRRQSPEVSGTSQGEREEQVIGLGEGADAAGTLEGLEAVSDSAPAGETEFFGTEAMAYHIIYLIDRSGSMGMLDKFESVSREIVGSLSELQPAQSFHIVLFSAGQPLEVPHDQLVPARMDNKRRAAEALQEVVPETTRGQLTDPRQALERAFDVLEATGSDKPKLIMFLTDGVFQGTTNEAVIETIDRLNPDRRIRINTFLYGSEDNQAASVMKRIADDNNGKYKYVSLDE
ncbi:MAG: vWA domain-containing protein [Phycisphaerae bacterium]